MEELLDTLSFSETFIKYIEEKSEVAIKEATKSAKKTYTARLAQIAAIKTKMENLEEKLIDNEIDIVTFRKWKSKLSQQEATLQNDVNNIRSDSFRAKTNKMLKNLSVMTSLKHLYITTSDRSRQKLLNMVFKGNLTFNGKLYRTPSVHRALRGNLLIAKEKGSSKPMSPLVILAISRSVPRKGFLIHYSIFHILPLIYR